MLADLTAAGCARPAAMSGKTLLGKSLHHGLPLLLTEALCDILRIVRRSTRLTALVRNLVSVSQRCRKLLSILTCLPGWTASGGGHFAGQRQVLKGRIMLLNKALAVKSLILLRPCIGKKPVTQRALGMRIGFVPIAHMRSVLSSAQSVTMSNLHVHPLPGARHVMQIPRDTMLCWA